jgi:hypothetical protein
MDKDVVVEGDYYLFRLKGKQVPVLMKSKAREGRKLVYRMLRLDTNEWLVRGTARALSRHYDDCNIWVGDMCDCVSKIMRIVMNTK